MTPSVNPGGEAEANNIEVPEKKDAYNRNEQHKEGSRPEKTSKKDRLYRANVDQKEQKPVKVPEEGKLAGKELKERAKAEKAAKRAKQKQEQQCQQGQPVINLQTGDNTDAGHEAATKRSTGPSPGALHSKGQDRRTGSSNAANSQKSLPLRSEEIRTIPAPIETPKENKHVALFDHLYGPPRRATLSGASKDVHPSIQALGLQMSACIICGSNARCVATLLSFKRVIEAYTTPPGNSLPRHLTTHLSSQIDYLISCRPLSVSMGNAIRWLKVTISGIDPSTPEQEAKKSLCGGIDNFIRERITIADRVIATKASAEIRDGDVILTYAKSSIVQKTLLEAYSQGKKFRVIVVDSRPLHEGKHLARALADLGLEVQYTLTHGLSHVMKSATKVFLGAHAMLSNGSLYSRVGTAMVAMAAHTTKNPRNSRDDQIPVIVCCESIKFTDRVALDSFVMNEVAPPDELILQGTTTSPLEKWREVPNLQLLNLMYDLTPSEYINTVISEYGAKSPSAVPVLHRLGNDG